MANQIIAVKSLLKETLPVDLPDRIDCVNVLVVLFALPNVFVHKLVENLTLYGDEIGHNRPISVDECQQLLDQLEKLGLVTHWVHIYRVSEDLKSECERVNREAGFDE